MQKASSYKIQNQGFDHVEFVVKDIATQSKIYERMGFEKIGERHLADRGTKSVVWAQGFMRVVLTQSDGSSAGNQEESLKFLEKYAEGICVLAIDVDSASAAFEETVARGAKPAMKPTVFESPEGRVVRAEIWSPGAFRFAFIERKPAGFDERTTANGLKSPALFDEKLVVSRLESPSPLGIRLIDHLTNNINMGRMDTWMKFYHEVFGFASTRHFKISTGRTGLLSDVIESPCRKIKVPINEATEEKSQVQEFVNRMRGGEGVQHLALLTTDLISTLKKLREQKFKFLTVPHAYYEMVPTRIKGVTEDLKELEDLGILLDGDTDDGYLLQIFSEEILGPFFFEYIQRKGDQGFGEGNFKALFEAIERDQIKRGVL